MLLLHRPCHWRPRWFTRWSRHGAQRPHERRRVRHFHLFAGLGGGARGFNRGAARVGQMQARFRCIGGIDVDHAAMRDFQRLADNGREGA